MTPDGGAAASVLDWVCARAGLRRDGHRGRYMALDVADAMADAGFDDPAAFVRYLETQPEAEAAVIDRIFNRETCFFRNRTQIEVLSNTILPHLRRERGGQPVRLCSAGCATGEEAYTLAILAQEAGLRRSSVLGLDRSTSALDQARRARYRAWALRNVEGVRRCFFRPDGDEFVVVDGVRRAVRFDLLDLTRDRWPPVPAGSFDVVLCCNVLVYLVADVVRAVADRLAASIAPGGWLLLAPTDPWLPCGETLVAVQTPAGIVYHRPLRPVSSELDGRRWRRTAPLFPVDA